MCLHLDYLIIIGVSCEDKGGDVRGEVSRVWRDRLPAPRLTFLMVTMIIVVVVIMVIIIMIMIILT